MVVPVGGTILGDGLDVALHVGYKLVYSGAIKDGVLFVLERLVVVVVQDPDICLRDLYHNLL